MSNTDIKTEKKQKKSSGFYFLAAAVVATAVVWIALKENKRIKEENELLSYEVW